jgi:hypothetical protein
MRTAARARARWGSGGGRLAWLEGGRGLQAGGWWWCGHVPLNAWPALLLLAGQGRRRQARRQEGEGYRGDEAQGARAAHGGAPGALPVGAGGPRGDLRGGVLGVYAGARGVVGGWGLPGLAAGVAEARGDWGRLAASRAGCPGCRGRAEAGGACPCPWAPGRPAPGADADAAWPGRPRVCCRSIGARIGRPALPPPPPPVLPQGLELADLLPPPPPLQVGDAGMSLEELADAIQVGSPPPLSQQCERQRSSDRPLPGAAWAAGGQLCAGQARSCGGLSGPN